MNQLLSMSAFALACSITPGPVNIVALSTGVRRGAGAAMRHVTSATIGFTLLLLLVGLGLHRILARWPQLTHVIQWAGVAFLLYMAWQLARDDGTLSTDHSNDRPSLASGAVMQWLNPKAWLASMAGMGAYAANGDSLLVWRFTALYFVICYASLSCWAVAGTLLRQHLHEPSRVRLFNRSMALLLGGSAIYLLKA
ncbi:lysine transporter LysE [Caballeronia mineralivorans PML1(12)]|uniref:Lysine transporter LysE n=1 Tax=Caballeronia mineralivorans PML1(12) TaxID=908627 RepID=A0A0J1D0R6_9BURK|nr:LysE family translocator [Caballeronia mineralivorans]KLU26364.1 lysine transporter LysE [Caballeronia mineralivorans PML1(12)]